MYSFLRGAQRDKSTRRYNNRGNSAAAAAAEAACPEPDDQEDAGSILFAATPSVVQHHQHHHYHHYQQQHHRRRGVSGEQLGVCSTEWNCDSGCQRIKINVAGELFETQLRTLRRFPNTLLGNDEKRQKFWDPGRGQYFFDRHRPSFAAILNYYQSGGRLRRPSEVPEEVFYEELRFFQLDDAVIRSFLVSEGYSPLTVRYWSGGSNWRTRLFSALHYPKTTQLGRLLAGPSVALIVLSVALHCLHLPPVSCSDSDGNNRTVGSATRYLPNIFGPNRLSIGTDSVWLSRLEFACVLWFALEFCIKLAVCPLPRIHLAHSAAVWLDAISFAPYFVSVTMETAGILCSDSGLMRALHFSHVLRIFKLYRYVTGMQILGRTLRMSIRELTMFLFFVGVSVVLFASAIHQAEGATHRQFQSIPHSFWWAVISLCTVGYGDAVPRTLTGKLIGSACVVAGVMTVALPVPVIVTNFNSVYRRTVLLKRAHNRPELVHKKLLHQFGGCTASSNHAGVGGAATD